MAGEIASLLVKLGLDSKAFTDGLTKANQQTQAFGSKTAALGTVAKAGFLAVGAGLAVVTKGAAEAERAQGQFMAATGASRDEAKQFVSGMDSLAGSAGAVGQSFDQIAATGTMVQQQFGTAGQATTDLTSSILEFAKVTGGDATTNAAQLDDTLTAYGLSAKDAVPLMDALTVSQQKFGTNIQEGLPTLQKMAPALDAMGLSAQDGVGILNMFEAAGLDSSKAAVALQTAVKGLQPGQSLNDLIAQIGAIQDPTERAQAAMKLFGSRAGTGLANAIKPGMTSLDDFKISAGDAADATANAADNMLTTGDRIKGLADKFLAGAREIGQQFGPALTGAASLASLSAPFIKGFAKMAAPAAKAFAKPFTEALGKAIQIGASFGQRIGAKIAAPLTNALAGAFTSLAGNSKISGSMDKLGGFMGGKLGGAMKTGFLAAGIIGLIAVAIQEWGDLQKQIDANKKATASINDETSNYLAGMPSPADVQSKIDALKSVPQSLTGIQGALYNLGSLGEGNVLGSAVDALFGANPAQVVDDKIKQMTDYLNGPGKDAVGAGVDNVAGAVADGAGAVTDAFAQYVTAFEDGSGSLEIQGQILATEAGGVWDLGPDIMSASADTQTAVAKWVQDQNAAVDAGAASVAQSLDAMRTKITDQLSGIQDAFDLGVDTKKKKNVSGAKRLQQMADDINTITKNLHDSVAANDPVNTAYWESALITAQQKYDTASQNISVDAAQVASDLGDAGVSMNADWLAAGKDAKHGAQKINTAADSVNAQPAATSVANAATDIHDSVMHIGTYASNVPGLISQADKGASAAAKHLAALISDPLNALNPLQWGTHIGDDLAAGMRIGNKTISAAAVHWAHLISDPIKFSRPPLTGPLHTIGQWGPHMIEEWIGPMERHGMTRVPEAARRLADYLASLSKAAIRSNGIGDPAIAAPGRPPHVRHHGRSWHDAHNPDVGPAAAASDGVTVNVTVNGNVYGPGGTKQLAADLERYIKRSTRAGNRLVGAF